MQLERGEVPLYSQLREIIRSDIVQGKYEPGERLAPEAKVGEGYGVSLTTVRRAFADLAREGLIKRIPGKGTFVVERRLERDLGKLTSFSQEMQRRNLSPSNIVIHSDLATASPRISNALNITEEKNNVFRLKRVRLVNDIPLMLENAYLPNKLFDDIEKIDWETKLSLYNVILEEYKTPLIEARESIEPILINPDQAEVLNVEPFSPALHLITLVYTENNLPVEFTDAVVPGQRSRYYVNMKEFHQKGEASMLAERSFSFIQPS